MNQYSEMVKVVGDTCRFICTSQFWKMAVMWTLSLIYSYMRLLLLPKCKTIPRCSLDDRKLTSPSGVKQPVCIITGATSGLGAAAAYALSMEGYCVVLVGRSAEMLSKVVSDIKCRNKDACLKSFVVDLSSFKSILKFESSLQQWLADSDLHPSIQLLINNAGILATSSRVTSEGFDGMMATNYIGAFCLTKVLLPLLENSIIPSRVVNVSSFTHWNVYCKQVDRNTVTGKSFIGSSCYPYASIYEYSKLCLLLFSYELHRQVSLVKKSQRLSVVAVDPGAVKTNIMREIPSPLSNSAFTVMKLLGLLQSPDIGIRSVLDAALAPPEVSGVYFFGGNGKTMNSSLLSYDSKLAKDLWDTSCNLFQELHQAS